MSQKGSFSSRLLMPNLRNLRDLGGLATQSGLTTVFGRFLRSDAPIKLNSRELDTFTDYPLVSAFDLRSYNEIKAAPSVFSNQSGVNVHYVPLLGQHIEDGILAAQNRKRETGTILSDLYIHLLEESKPQLGHLGKLIAQAPSGALLFHCTHGKDRTGLVSALLLLIAGVQDEDIIANYQVSHTYLKSHFESIASTIPEHVLPFLSSDPIHMEITLNYFHQHYHSIENYFEQCGVAKEAQKTIRQRLLNPHRPEV